MAKPARFLFDNDFGAPPPPEPEAPRVPTIEVPLHQALLAEAERVAFERGQKAGREDADARAAGRLADEAARLASAAQSILAVLDADRLRIEKDAVQLAEVIGRHLAGALVDLHPHEAVLSVIEEALAPLRQTPHLVVRLAAADCGPVGEALRRIAEERGFEGRLVILGEDDIGRGDCRIDWADGGIVLDRSAAGAAVAAAVGRHLALLDAEAKEKAAPAAAPTDDTDAAAGAAARRRKPRALKA